MLKLSSMNGKTIKCRAAICWSPNRPLTVENIEVEPPREKEVRIKVVANSICHSDLHVVTGHAVGARIQPEFPCILGHEATGVVESVGDGVTLVSPGDTVITLYSGQCGECSFCLNPKTNICLTRSFYETRMSDGSTRFSFKGKPVYYFLGISSLTEYTVIHQSQVAKINSTARMDRACIFACGFPTGYGASVNSANVEKDSNVGVWGLGAVGLAAVYGARVRGAKNIIGIDINDEKESVARKIGCNYFVNPLKCKEKNKTTFEIIKEITNGIGLDFAIECVGSIETLQDAIASLSPWGTVVNVGINPGNRFLKLNPNDLHSGIKITGTATGAFKCRDSVPKLVEDYVNGTIDVEDFFTANIKLDDVDEAFNWLLKGKALRTVVVFK